MGSKFVSVEAVQVPQSTPSVAGVFARRRDGAFERHEGCRASGFNRAEVSLSTVGFVPANFPNGVEGLGGCVQQIGQLRGIRRLRGRRFDCGNDIRRNASHEVRLNPQILDSLLAPFVVLPAEIATGGKAGAVDGEVRGGRAKQ